ncbi:MAG: tetratricopeptide repeat protein [Flavobacteriales bacterium]
MSDGFRPIPDGDHQRGCVQRYEAMLRRNSGAFFDVDDLVLIIDHYLQQNDTRRAKEALDFAQAQHPGSIELMMSEAVVLMNLGRLNKALEVLDAIGRVEPYSADVHLHKGSIFSHLRNYRRAIEHYTRALELAEEGHDEILLDLAFEHESLGQYDEAIGHLKRALGINPENEGVLYELAYCFEQAGADQSAVAFFKAFTNEHPYSFVAWYSLANALSRLERVEESIEAIDLCLAINEAFPSAYHTKARNLVVLGRYGDAVACYEEAMRLEGPQAATFSCIGECHEKMERFEQALICYDQAVALDPNWVDAWIGRGVVKELQGRLAEAVRDLEVAVRLAPEHGDAWYYFANALGRSGRYDDSLAAYGRLNALEPENLDGWMDHADLLLGLKGPEAAMRKLCEGGQVHQLNPRYKYRLASYLLRMGREQQALVELEEALIADHSGHKQLFEHYPEAAARPQVLHLIGLYAA